VKISRFETEEDWKQARLGRIMGTRAGGIMPNKNTKERKKGFWEAIAERLSVDDGYMDMMERGKDLEKEAIDRFTKETGVKIDDGLVIWSRADNDSIAVSPDGYTKDLKEAVEVKCLNTASHIEAIVTGKIPGEYTDQVLQYFVVNDDLEKLYFIFYDPRIKYKDFFYIEVLRDDAKVAERLEIEKEAVDEINRIVNELSGF